MASIRRNQPQQAHRRSQKVKTGCRTCKIRRVKCDEKRPSCFRCTSTGRTCDGYSSFGEAIQLPSHRDNQVSGPQNAVPLLTDFGNNVRYLEFYHHCVQPALSSSFDKEFWSRTTLQMAHSEATVRHALIALSYLYQTESGSMKHARARLTAFSGRKTLLSHYTKSVGILVNRMDESTYSPEIGLVSCLLFVCIEFLQGNYNTGFTHMTNGLKIISEWQKRKQKHVQFPITKHGSQLVSSSSIGTNGIIVDTLIPIFIRSMASALIYGVDAEKVFDVPWPILTNPEQMVFTTFREAQETIHELRNASILHIRSLAVKFFRSNPTTDEDLRHQSKLLKCHQAWLRGLELYEGEYKLSRDEQIAASALRVTHYSTIACLSGAAEARQTPYDAHLDSFKEVIRHVKVVIDSQVTTKSHAAHFTFDISIIPPLFYVATRCRCPNTRREAVSLLARKPPREGLWDPEQHVVVLNRVIEMEEREVDPITGWPVETTRLWSVVIDGNMDQSGGFWVYFLLAKWVGEVEPDVLKTKVRYERFVL